MAPRDIALALLVILFWGGNFVAIRVGLDGVPPMLMVAIRFLLSAFPAILLLRRPNIPWRYLLGYALLVGVGQYTLLYGAIKLGMPAGLSSILMQIQAFATVFTAAVVLKERVHWTQLAGLAVALCGLALIASTLNRDTALLPLLMVLGAALSWGSGNVVTRAASNWAAAHRVRIDALAFTAWGCLAPIVPMFALSALVEGVGVDVDALAHLNWASVLALLYTAYVSTVFAFGTWNRLIAKYGASQVAPFSLLVPFSGVLNTAIWIGERIVPTTLAAAALVICGLALNVWGRALVRRVGVLAR